MSLDLKVFEVLTQYRVTFIDDYRKDYVGHINHSDKTMFINRNLDKRTLYCTTSGFFSEAYCKLHHLDDRKIDEE